MHQCVQIKGINNIHSSARIFIGVENVGFAHRSDVTYLNIRGKLQIAGQYSIGRGCRFDIGEKAVVTIGHGGYVNSNTNFIIAHSLTIGDNCAISWDCQFLDEDFHAISYDGKKEIPNEIKIGNNVWIGCGVKVYKGAVIPDGCVIAANSVVKGVFHKENSLIGGFPAKILKENVKWQLHE